MPENVKEFEKIASVSEIRACPNFCVNGFRLKQSDTLAELNGKPV